MKQKKFVENYIKTGNGTQAAIDAGYSNKTAYSMANENLKKPEIKQKIDARTAEIAAKTTWTIERLVKKHENLIAQAEAKGDLSTATANIVAIGKTIAAYSERTINIDDAKTYIEANKRAEAEKIAKIRLLQG